MAKATTTTATTTTELEFAPSAHAALVEGAAARLAYVFSGRAVFTLRSAQTGKHYTYQVRASDHLDVDGKPTAHFVRVLCGGDGEYLYLGTVVARGPLRLTGGSALDDTAPSVRAFRWFQRNPAAAHVEFWHAGVCGRCGRELTDPESVRTGLGPVCRTR